RQSFRVSRLRQLDVRGAGVQTSFLAKKAGRLGEPRGFAGDALDVAGRDADIMQLAFAVGLQFRADAEIDLPAPHKKAESFQKLFHLNPVSWLTLGLPELSGRLACLYCGAIYKPVAALENCAMLHK